jgi:hypothetical protein
MKERKKKPNKYVRSVENLYFAFSEKASLGAVNWDGWFIFREVDGWFGCCGSGKIAHIDREYLRIAFGFWRGGGGDAAAAVLI